MARTKSKSEALLKDLMGVAEQMNVQVRNERLLREIGYHPRSGSCRVQGKEVIILDKDTPARDQVEFLLAELRERQDSLGPLSLPPHLERLLKKS